ncbi:hypothetical protein RHSIM_Rhsim02G0184800 [Rhododendron simsii]|uniref:Protein FAR1-RELATED SEQUENCE n=1 Tax=Rhododendron simsii TaxID=118357 RepID=A0A834LUT0_RHOSS|nr:hypothetical protein RHSIM_Rhsim02G0184800 [Rhododendron simsii]
MNEADLAISTKTTKHANDFDEEQDRSKPTLGEEFVVTQFSEGHNHPLTMPRKRHFLRSHRQVSIAHKALTQQLAAANVSTSQQMTVLELQVGGVNHHGQTTLFGCAFLCDETTESFEWLFKEFLKAMPRPPLKMIITDQDPAMTKAIANALPNTFHRYCIWHIVSKFSEKLGALAYKQHYEEFQKVALTRIRHNELDLDHNDINERSILKITYLMEKRMSELYTLQAFRKFQEELFQLGAYVVKKFHEDEYCSVWKVQREEMEDSRSHEVSVDNSSNHVSYSCKMFEFDGCPCRHMLAYLFTMQIRKLPSKYILQRWTKTAKLGRVMDDLGSNVREICGSSIFVRRQGLFQLACTVIDDAILDDEGTEVVQEDVRLDDEDDDDDDFEVECKCFLRTTWVCGYKDEIRRAYRDIEVVMMHVVGSGL